MSSASVDLFDLLELVPPGAWAAISEAQHRLLAYGLDAHQVLVEAQTHGEEHPLIVRVPDEAMEMFL